ncbi:MAG: adenine phosphoribosyltransferase [Chloroflexota bacterium]|nr:adenine phosphoribosyltransferase [Chloroflexota bacterium]
MQLNSYIRTIQDFPVPGISFKDITPLLADADALQYAVDRMLEQCEPMRPDVIVSVEARGFLLAAPMAYRLGKPLVPVRKQGKLPYEKFSTSYDLEYGTGTLQIHTDAISDGQRALIVDDLLATGGTVSATAELVRECGGNIAGYAFLIELSFLDGRNKLGGVDVDIVSLITYDS